MKRSLASLFLIPMLITGCGGAVNAYVADNGAPIVVEPRYEYLRFPTISGLEYTNSYLNNDLHLTSTGGAYLRFGADDRVSFVLGDTVLFVRPEYSQPFGSLYDANLYSISPLHSDTAVENLMALLMVIDDDGNVNNGIQIPYSVRVAAHGLRINFNQSAYEFRTNSAVQYAVSILSGNTYYGTRLLPSSFNVQRALQIP